MANYFHTLLKILIGSKHKVFPSICFLVLILISCDREAGQNTAAVDQGISQSHTRDSITLNLITDKKEITIAENLKLVLETSVPENIEVKFPKYSAGLGDFTLNDFEIHPPRLTGSGENIHVVHQATYLLEPYLSGTYTIPAMSVSYHDREKTLADTQIATDEITVAVHSLLDPDMNSGKIRDIRPPLPLPPDRILQFYTAGLVLLLVLLAAAGFYYWKIKKTGKLPGEVHIRPEETALLALENLLAEDLLAQGQVKLFHLRISDILRRYIENRFGLKAPDRTTEEFLTELSQSNSSGHALLGIHKNLLNEFLTQCDLVKFAKHKPTSAESEKTVVICQEFIEKTMEMGSRGQGISAHETADH